MFFFRYFNTFEYGHVTSHVTLSHVTHLFGQIILVLLIWHRLKGHTRDILRLHAQHAIQFRGKLPKNHQSNSIVKSIHPFFIKINSNYLFFLKIEEKKVSQNVKNRKQYTIPETNGKPLESWEMWENLYTHLYLL